MLSKALGLGNEIVTELVEIQVDSNQVNRTISQKQVEGEVLQPFNKLSVKIR